MRLVLQVVEMRPIVTAVQECHDETDNRILEVAVNGNAELIVSGDRDWRCSIHFGKFLFSNSEAMCRRPAMPMIQSARPENLIQEAIEASASSRRILSRRNIAVTTLGSDLRSWMQWNAGSFSQHPSQPEHTLQPQLPTIVRNR